MTLRQTWTSMKLLFEEAGMGKKWPERSTRGDEKLCAKCQYYDGEVADEEGRLICIPCAQSLGLIP